MTDRTNALINEQIILRIEFVSSTGSYFDPDSISQVQILDTDQITVLETILTASIIRDSIGHYHIITSDSWNNKTRNIFDKWFFVPAPSALARTITQNCYVDDVTSYKEDFRKGFAFNNPDTTRNNGFGAIITPDELRYIYAFGNPLFATSTGETFTDNILWWYIENAIAHLEKDLNYALIKKKVYAYPTGQVVRDDITFDPKNDLWDEPYDFDWETFKKYMYIKLRHFPINKVNKVVFRDPMGYALYDFTTWVRANRYTDGSLEFFPNLNILARVPFFTQYHSYATLMQNNRFPDAWWIDYEIGFNDVFELKSRHSELFSIVGMLAAISLLDDYGDGKTSSIASSSISLSGISESYSTTMSASVDANTFIEIEGKPTILEMFLNKEKYIGKKIKSVNIKNSKIEEKEILDIVEHDTKNKKCYRIFFENYSNIIITEDHSLFVKNGNEIKEIKGSEINQNTKIIFVKNNRTVEIKVYSIKEIIKDKMYDLSIKDNENFVCQFGILSHNTSAMFGARIISYKKTLKDWYTKNGHKYGNGRTIFTAL